MLRTGVRLGLFEALRVPQSPERLAERLGLEPDLVRAWAAVLQAQGWLRRRGDALALTSSAAWLLDAPEARALHDLLDEAVESLGERFAALPELMKGTVRPQFGAGEETERMAAIARLVEPRALRALDRVPGARRARYVLDVGCGQGSYLAGLLARYRDAQGVGIELDPAVAEQARERLREAEVSRRAEVRVGDFMTLELPKGAFDLILLNNDLHYFAPAERGALFRRARNRLAPDGVLAVQTPVVVSTPVARWVDLDEATALLDLVLRLHRNLHGLPDPKALHRVLQDSGFEETGEVAVLPGGAVRYVWARVTAAAG